MTHASSHWQVTPDATNDQAYAILAQDPVWNSFALADLEPPLRAYSQFAVAAQDESHDLAICLIVRHPIIGQVLSPFGEEAGIAAILAHIALPPRPLIQVPERHIALLRRSYQAETPWRRMLRMAITASSWQSTAVAPPRPVVRLGPRDLPALQSRYGRHPESTFSAELFPQGLYVGVFEGGSIIAAGGTHALVPRHGMALLGNILTAPEARGQGYATAITAALVTSLVEEHCSLVVLNVFEDNSPAIRVYQRLGFQTHHRLWSGIAVLAQ